MRSVLHGFSPATLRVHLLRARLSSPVLSAHWIARTRRTFSTAITLRDSAISTVQLRPYQEESIQAVLKYLENGEKRLGISLATGGGKTVIFSHLIDRVPSPNKDATQTLILAHRRELIDQAARHCRNLYPGKSVDVEMGRVHASGLADITVASVQSLLSGSRLMRYSPDRFKLVLVDEVHHVAAQSYLTVLEHFGLSSSETAKQGTTALVGVSATFSRADGLSLGVAIDSIVYHKDLADMIEEKWLSGVRFTTVKSGADLSKVKTSQGDFQTGMLSRAVNTPEINELTVRSWLTLAKDRKSTLVFCVDLAHVGALNSAFRTHGYDAHFVTSNTPLKQRAERLAAFRAGEFPVLINCGIFTEGTDIPNIDCILLARPTKSSNLLIQMVGRGLRNSPGKEDCHVIDMVASLAKGVVSTPTLFGLDPNELVDDATALALKDLKSRKEKELELAAAAEASSALSPEAIMFGGNITFTHFDDLQSLMENTPGEGHIRGISRLAWVQVDSQRYILSDRSGSYLTLERDEDNFVVTFTQAIPKSRSMSGPEPPTATSPEPKAGFWSSALRKLHGSSDHAAPAVKKAKSYSPYMRPVNVITTPLFEHAINAADTLAKKRFIVPILLASAAWRRGPATPEQLSFLNKFRSEDKQLQPGDMNKGSAGDWITKFKHGAQGRFKKMQTAKAKVEKERERGERTEVKVGPLSKETFR